MASTPSTSSNQIQNIENLNYSYSDNISYSNNGQSSSTLSTSSMVSSPVTCSVITQSYNLIDIVSTANNCSQVSSSSSKANPTINTSETGLCEKMTVEHSATVDKGLKMKIKRTKPGTKSSEAKHEIVKSNEVNGSLPNSGGHGITSSNTASDSLSTVMTSPNPHNVVESQCISSLNKQKSSHSVSTGSNLTAFSTSKKISSNHRREKGRDKHEKLPNIHVPQDTKLEVNGPVKQTTQNHSSSKIISESSGTIAIPTPTPLLHITTSSANDQHTTSSTFTNLSSAATSTSLVMSTTDVQSAAQAANNSVGALQVHGSVLRSKPADFQVSQNTTTDISISSPTYLSNTTLTESSAINFEQVKYSKPVEGVDSTENLDDKLITATESPPAKKPKSFSESELKEMSDVCVGTSIGTITEPDCLGPCEPGTSVTLEGIVWHETDGGVLVVNITWRGKTYVGTLLDCTRHDWAPPRFCDSPTSDLDVRLPKGRIKRGRTTTNVVSSNDLSNFTETRSSVHSKLRNNGPKGRRGIHGSPAASPCSAPFVPPRADSTTKRKIRCPEEDEKSKRKIPLPTPPSTSPPASPVLLECPEPNCCKKYKHINGLKYHQSHVHGSIDDDDTKEGITSMSENDESNIEPPSPVFSVKSPAEKIENTFNRLTNSSTNSLKQLSTESSLVLPCTLPDIESQPSQLPNKNIIEQAILKFENKDAAINIVSTSQFIQSSQIQTQFKTRIIDSESSNFLSTNSSPPDESPPPNTNSLQQFDMSNLVISSQIQKDKKNSVFQSDQPLHSQQSTCNDILPIAISSESDHHILQGRTGKKILVQTESSNSQVQNQQFSSLTGVVVCQHSTLHSFSDHILSQASTINQTVSPSVVSMQNIQTTLQPFSNAGIHTKIPHFKVKSTADLMPEDDNDKDSKISKIAILKKKSRKSPTISPRESLLETVIIDSERDDVQSPAYSDISDDATPSDVADTCNKLLKQHSQHDIKSSRHNHLATHFSMYPYYGQPSYLIQNMQEKPLQEPKISEVATKSDLKSLNSISVPSLSSLQTCNPDKDKKEPTSSHVSPQLQAHYYTNYNAYMSTGYPFQSQGGNCQTLNELSEPEFVDQKHRIKQESELQSLKEKHLENHQILKESIEIKSQMNPYQLYHNSQARRSSPSASISSDDRRFYIYSGEQRRKEETLKQNIAQKPMSLSPKHQLKQDKTQEINKHDEGKMKQEGVKPTMETHGPPPPPTSQYTYIHPGYIPSHHYGSISYDPGHPGIYRNLTPMIVPGTYTSNPFLHQLPRYHAPEDLSRSPNGKAIDILQHHANQYYSSHKIHELQERAIKSPTPKTRAASSSPLLTVEPISIKSPNGSTNNISGPSPSQYQSTLSSKQHSQNNSNQQQQQQQSACRDSTSNSSNKDNRSPPPQRHVHTHHHTHVGLGYPILPGQYPAPYGAAVLASQQAAAVAATVITPFPPK